MPHCPDHRALHVSMDVGSPAGDDYQHIDCNIENINGNMRKNADICRHDLPSQKTSIGKANSIYAQGFPHISLLE